MTVLVLWEFRVARDETKKAAMARGGVRAQPQVTPSLPRSDALHRGAGADLVLAAGVWPFRDL